MSYSNTSPQHRQWIFDLATFLRQNGIEARLDQWHLRKGMDLPHWMTNELEMADRVLLITDANYVAKAEGRLGGVGWETMIIQGDMMRLPPDNNKYVILVRETDFEAGLPNYLRTKYCIHWPVQSNEALLQQELLKELYDVEPDIPVVSKPSVWL